MDQEVNAWSIQGPGPKDLIQWFTRHANKTLRGHVINILRKVVSCKAVK